MMRAEVRSGSTRTVILVGSWAIKLPAFFGNGRGWRHFLCGLLANMQEKQFSDAGWPELCPVLWSIPGGFLVIMRRAEPLPRPEYDDFDFEAWLVKEDHTVPAEPKLDSFGLLGGRLVAVDYGS